MNPVSIGQYHGLRVGSALFAIVAGCIIIGVSRECDADAVGGIFLGAGGLGESLNEKYFGLVIFFSDYLLQMLQNKSTPTGALKESNGNLRGGRTSCRAQSRGGVQTEHRNKMN
uniref:Kinocilin n=1 Tax=Xiphophorus couchianus TaxID=32473 RepID=A0A3B5M7K3_9TELE